MDCKITGDSVMINEVFFDSVIEQPVETDFTLPDYCPDIGRILKCRATPRISVRNITGDKLTAEGVTRIEVVYVDGRDKHLRCCEHELPFSISVPLNECPEGAAAQLNAQLEYLNCRAVTQRRVDIRGAFSVRIRISARKSNEIISDAQGVGIRLRRRDAEISSCIGSVQNSFTISEALELAAGKPPIASVVRSSAHIKVGECRAITNKVILKGEAVVRIVYCTEPEGGIESMEYTVPFNQFVDLSGADDTCITDCSVSAVSLGIDLRTDSDGEYRRMNAEIRATADIAAYVTRSVTAVSDAYSVDCEVELDRRAVGFERYKGMLSGKSAVTAKLDFGKEIARVCDIWCETGDVSSNVRDNAVCIEGKAAVCVIVRCSDGESEYMEKTLPFECRMPVDGGIENGRAGVSVYTGDCSFTLNGASGIAVKAEIICSASAFEDNTMSCICGIKPDLSRPKKHEDEPALVVYYAEAGEDLWSIAREHNASMQTICHENGIEEEELGQPRMLLISVR